MLTERDRRIDRFLGNVDPSREDRIRLIAERIQRDIAKDKPKRRPKRSVSHRNWRPVVCVELRQTFKHCSAAAAATGLKRTAIYEAAKHGWRCGGFRWQFVGSGCSFRPSKSRTIIRARDGARIEKMSLVVPACFRGREYRREMSSLRRKIRSGKPYRGEVYIYAGGYREH